jgi:orotidine-5'-phosphate decarboxylase
MERKKMKTFVDELVKEIQKKQSILCVGLDPQLKYLPPHILDRGYDKARYHFEFEPEARAIVDYFEEIIKAVAPYAVAVKPQMAFYEHYGHWGVWAFEQIVKIAKENDLLVIEDAKRCDGGDTAKAYAEGHLGMVDVWNAKEQELTKEISPYDVDAMTVIPQIGSSCLNPFVEIVKRNGKGIFVVDKTSFTPNSEVEQLVTTSGRKVWEEIALLVKKWSEGCEGKCGLNNVGVVMGATYPEDAPKMREYLPDCFFLVPGYGAQGGGADGAVRGARKDGLGVIVNSSRDIDYAYQRERFKCDPKDFAQAAAKAAEFSRNDLNEALKRAGKLPW